MSHSYSSDISREQFARILPCLESARRRTKPRTVDLYDVFCGVVYLLKSGCQWRMLPADFPDWRTCREKASTRLTSPERSPACSFQLVVSTWWLLRSLSQVILYSSSLVTIRQELLCSVDRIACWTCGLRPQIPSPGTVASAFVGMDVGVASGSCSAD